MREVNKDVNSSPVQTSYGPTSKYTIFFVFLIGCGGGLYVYREHTLLATERLERARRETKGLAEGLAAKFQNPNARRRRLRNVSAILGSDTFPEDPWGRHYHGEVTRNSYGQPQIVFVWSGGPNQRNDSGEISAPKTGRDQKVDLSQLSTSSSIFGGDDVGAEVRVDSLSSGSL